MRIWLKSSTDSTSLPKDKRMYIFNDIQALKTYPASLRAQLSSMFFCEKYRMNIFFTCSQNYLELYVAE